MITKDYKSPEVMHIFATFLLPLIRINLINIYIKKQYKDLLS
jgi:hypothetical protein